MKKFKGIGLAVGLILILAAAVFVNQNTQQKKAEEEALTEQQSNEVTLIDAVDFTVYDAQGNEVKLSDFKGKPIILTFWAEWCPYCKQQMPLLQEYYDEYGEEIQFLEIWSKDESRSTMEDAIAYIEENGYTFPAYYDDDLEASIAYSAYALPLTYYINEDFQLVAKTSGALNDPTLKSVVEMLLGEGIIS